MSLIFIGNGGICFAPGLLEEETLERLCKVEVNYQDISQEKLAGVLSNYSKIIGKIRHESRNAGVRALHETSVAIASIANPVVDTELLNRSLHRLRMGLLETSIGYMNRAIQG